MATHPLGQFQPCVGDCCESYQTVDCMYCPYAAGPEEMQVDISGALPYLCREYPVPFNRTFILPYVGSCVWELDGIPTCTDYGDGYTGSVKVRFWASLPGAWWVHCWVSAQGPWPGNYCPEGRLVYEFRADQDSIGSDCLAWDHEVLPYFDSNSSFCLPVYDFTNLLVKVTSLI